MVISKIAKPQAKETVDDVLPSEIPSSVGFPKLRGFSNTKLIMYESILFISSFIAENKITVKLHVHVRWKYILMILLNACYF